MTSPPPVLPAGRPWRVPRPRVCSVPPYSSTAGAEAVELAASAGLVLDPWQCEVLTDSLGEREDGKWSAFEIGVIVSRQNGKGALLEARTLAGLFLFGERLILHTAHEFKTAAEGFRRILSLIEGRSDFSRLVRKVNSSHGEEGIELRTGQRLRFLARSKGAGRGFSGDLVIWDEAYALTPLQVEAQMPTLSARENPQLWYTSSPPLDAVSGEVLIRLRERGQAGAKDLAYFDFGMARGIDLDDREAWRAANPGMPIRISEEFVARERSAMTDEGFGRERLGIWPPSAGEGWAVIPEQDWLDALDPTSKLDGALAFGIDVTPDRGHAAISAAGRRPDGKLHVEVVEHKAGTGWVAGRMEALAARWKPVAVVVDGSGPAGSLIAPLEQRGIEVIKPSARDMTQACGQLYDGVSGVDVSARNIRHIDQVELTLSLAGAVRRDLGDAWAWSRRDATVDICPLVATTLAAWGFETYAHRVVEVIPWAVYA